MELPNSYKARLDELECLFKWRPDIGGKQKPVEWFIEKCEIGMEEAPFMTLHELAILSYLYTLKSPKMSITKAIDCIKQANKWPENNPQERFMTCDFVLRANKLHIDYLICMQDEDKLSRLETEWSDRESNPKWEAAVWGTKGYAMARFMSPKEEQVIEAFKEAYRLDVNNPHWYFGHACFIDGNAKANLGWHYKTSDYKMDLLKKAYKLGKYLELGPRAIHAARYGEALLIQALFNKNTPMKSSEQDMCLEVIRFAHENAGLNQCIHRICAKSYKKLKRYRECRNCLEEGIAKCPDNTALYFPLGMFFLKDREDRCLLRARECFEMSKKESTQGYFWAEMELLKMKINGELKDNTTDTLVEFARLAAMSSKDPTYRAALHKERGLYLLQCGGMDDIAVDEFLKAAMSETDNQYGQAMQARKEIKIALEERMETGGLKQKRDLALFLQKCQPQMDDYLEESAKFYKEILETNDMNSEDTSFIVENYGDVLIRLKWYDEAIQVLDKNGVSKGIMCLAAQAHIGAAKQDVSKFAKEKHLRRCLALHCKNGAEGLLDHLKTMVKNADAKAEDKDALCFQQSMLLCNDCALIIKTLTKDPLAFSLETGPPLSQEAVIEREIVEVLGLNVPGFRELRNSRYEMSLDPDDSLRRIVPVLCEARNQLDRVHKRLLAPLDPEDKLRGNFPLSLNLQSEGDNTIEKVKEELGTYFTNYYTYKTSKKVKIHVWKDFVVKYSKQSEDLLDFLATKQVAGKKWLQKWFTLTNDHKHVKEITWQHLDDWTQLFDSGHVSTHAEAAHVVAEFAEEHVAKYDSIMRECFEI